MTSPIDTAQRAVQCKLGRCTIRLQQYEGLLKALVATSPGEGGGAQPGAIGEDQLAGTRRKTLGILLRRFTGDLQAVDYCAQFQFDMPADAFEATMHELGELVDLRNELTHHFLERCDLSTVAGCAAAEAWLDACGAKIAAHLCKLRLWAAVIDEARASLPLFLEMSEAEANDIARYLEKFRRGAG